MNTLLNIVLMAVVTFSCRYVFLAQSIRFELPGLFRRALDFTAPAVLTAMWAPIVFQTPQGPGSVVLPYLLAGLCTIALSLLTRKTLVVVGVGMLLFGVARWWLSQGAAV